jgi:hypothetical protein
MAPHTGRIDTPVYSSVYLFKYDIRLFPTCLLQQSCHLYSQQVSSKQHDVMQLQYPVLRKNAKENIKKKLT